MWLWNNWLLVWVERDKKKKTKKGIMVVLNCMISWYLDVVIVWKDPPKSWKFLNEETCVSLVFQLEKEVCYENLSLIHFQTILLCFFLYVCMDYIKSDLFSLESNIVEQMPRIFDHIAASQSEDMTKFI